MEKLSENAFQYICRTCLMYQDILFNIEEVQWEDISLNNILKRWISLNKTNMEQMPPNICKPCISDVYYFYEFIEKCRNSERILQAVINSNMQILKQKTEEFENKFKIEDDSFTHKSNGDFFIKDEEDFFDSSLKSNDCNSEDDSFQKANLNASLDNNVDQIKSQSTAKLEKLKKANIISSRARRKKSKEPPFICITCHSMYKTYEALKKHKIETKHKKALKFSCEYCKKKYDAYSKYVEHCRTHTGEKPNVCQACGKAFNFKTDLKRHMILHENTKPHTCRFCDKGFTRKQYLNDHERKHTGERLICSFCGQGFHSYSNLIYHEKTHKGPPGTIRDPKTTDRLYQCTICKKVLLTEHTLKSHVLLHGPKNFSCDKCGKMYISRQRLQDHIRFAHQDRTFACAICKKIYKHKNGLDFHVKSHLGQNIYPCDSCEKKFACKGSLYQHRRIHAGDTTYQCSTCRHICINKRHLENHLRTHTGEKPFACAVCGKVFAQKANMVAHSRMHTEERNHWCKDCGKGFYDKRSLKKHMVIHETSDPNMSKVSLNQNSVVTTAVE